MLSIARINRTGFRWLQHLLFWVFSYFIFLQLFKTGNRPEKIDYIYTGLFQLTIIPAVYLNLELLLPYLTRTKKWWFYIAGLVILLIVFPFINYRFFQEWSARLLPDYFFISYFSFTEIVVFFSVYLFITSLLKLSRSWFTVNELRNRLLETEKEKAQMELRALKSQINPHFLFNTLNSIYSLSLDKDDRLPGTVLQLSDIMRYYLYESREDLVPLKKELQMLQDYIHLQQMRSDNRLEILMTMEGEPQDYRIAPLLLITFVENAFKHSVKGKTGRSFIHLNMEIRDGKFSFRLENNKGKVDEVEPENYKGLGLENVKRRLALLYPGRHGLTVREDEHIFSILLHLQL